MVVDEIQTIFKDEHVPVWGISYASKMANEPAGYRSDDLLLGARSLICFGIPVPRGVYHAPIHAEETIWRSQNLYYRRLDTLSIRIATILEESGESAIPTYGCMPLGMNSKGVVDGYFNQIRMGEVTGMGFIGKNGLLLHPQYGARLMLGGVISTAELPEIRHPDTKQLSCPTECRICAEVCPVNAIMVDKKQVKIMRCLSYTSRTPLMSRIKLLALRLFNPQAAARYMSLTSFDELTFHVCSRCVALCPYGDSK